MTTLVLLLSALVIGGEDPAQTDLEKLQGTWYLTAKESDGEQALAEDIQGETVVYEQNHVTLRSGDRVRKRGIITLDATRKPKAMNTWDRDGPYEDQTIAGIYELEGDTLKVCFARPGEERPREFTTKSGTAFLLCIYKRKPR